MRQPQVVAGRLIAGLAALAVLVLLVTGTASPGVHHNARRGQAAGTLPAPTLPDGRSAIAVPIGDSVGALFPDGLSGGHSCTAGVVDSPHGDLVVTAAHCVSGTGVGMIFAPGYLNGTAPYGTWVVRAAYASTAWVADQRDGDDVAFLVVAPGPGGSATTVQDAVGGSVLATAPAIGRFVSVRGYVSGSDVPVSCSARVYLDEGYPAFDCAGFAGGTSGSPWIAQPAKHGALPRMVGVIGGLDQGGCLRNTSYSAAFNAGTVALFERAVAGTAPSVLPPADSDC